MQHLSNYIKHLSNYNIVPYAFAKFITMQSVSNVMSRGMQGIISIEKYENFIHISIKNLNKIKSPLHFIGGDEHL